MQNFKYRISNALPFQLLTPSSGGGGGCFEGVSGSGQLRIASIQHCIVLSVQISNLLAKVMPAAKKAKPALAAANISYQVQWQAMTCADYPATSARQNRQCPYPFFTQGFESDLIRFKDLKEHGRHAFVSIQIRWGI